jgi:hypothetical protein
MQPKLQPDAWLLAQASLKYFCVKFLNFHWPEHYQSFAPDLESRNKEDARLLYEVARGHGKSNIVSLAYPLWRVIRGKWEGILVSYSEDQVKRLIRDIRQTVMSNPFLEPIRPTTAETWGTDMLSFPNGAELKGLGFGTSGRGHHPDDIIVDDPLKDIGGMTAEDQERAFFGVIEGMAMEHTKITVVGTPVAYGDLLHKLEDPGRGYKFKSYPALKNDSTPLFPELWSAQALADKKQRMGSLIFAREYMLQRIDPETQPFKSQYETLYEEAPTNFARIITACDPAYSETDGDETAIVTVGVTHGNHAYVLEAKAIRREEPGRIVDELFRTITTFKPDSVGIEKKKGESVSYTFNERRVRLNTWDFKYVELPTGRGKNDTDRIGGLVPRWEARTIHVHKNQHNFLREIYEYRMDDSHRHDDLVDALAYCFHPEMATPNSGKTYMPGYKTPTYSKSMYAPGRATRHDTQINSILGRKAAA